jgi:hypothetical protein
MQWNLYGNEIFLFFLDYFFVAAGETCAEVCAMLGEA